MTVISSGRPTDTRKKAVCLLSGGMDSTTLLYRLLYEDFDVTALSVLYGQRHEVEIEQAGVIAHRAGVPCRVFDARQQFKTLFEGAKSSQVNPDVEVPTGHYADPSMALTVVPNRNMILLALAGGLAEAIGAGVVAYAAHAGDHPIYPDCRPGFAVALNEAFMQGTDRRVRIYAPFLSSTKTDICRMAAQLSVPLELTYSCYKGTQGRHCGECGTCYERREAFRDSGISDPTVYAKAS